MSTSGGKGGGGTPSICTFVGSVQTGGPVTQLLRTITQQVVNPITNQFVGTACSTPFLVAPGGLVCSGEGTSADNVDTTSGDFIVESAVTISNLTGTEVLTMVGYVDIPVAGPGQSGSIVWSEATITAVTGTDLTSDGQGDINSTAGGVFVVSVTAFFGYD